jgi:YegS/Rv2252/BmrU family lipid kinase
MKSTWFAIINPTSGNNKGLKHLNHIKDLFIKYEIPVIIVLSEYIHHEKILAQQAIKQGYTKIISIGGDGTLHHIVNGIMSQKTIESNKIKLAVIPVGTGNDWIKTYNIPNNIEQAVQIIKKEKIIYQDIGSIKFLENKNEIYFNNLAGIGFDAFVVQRITSFKKLGSISYLLGGLTSFFSYKKSLLEVIIGQKKIKSKIFMTSIGLCKYSGGNMQLTNFNNHKKGAFDITIIKNISLIKILMNLRKLYNGKIIDLTEVETHQNQSLTLIGNKTTFIQADGELLGKGNVEINIINDAIQYVVPKI